HALLVLLAHGGDIGVNCLAASRDMAPRSLTGPDCLQHLPDIRLRQVGQRLHRDPDSPGWQVWLAVQDESPVGLERALDVHDGCPPLRLLLISLRSSAGSCILLYPRGPRKVPTAAPAPTVPALGRPRQRRS